MTIEQDDYPAVQDGLRAPAGTVRRGMFVTAPYDVHADAVSPIGGLGVIRRPGIVSMVGADGNAAVRWRECEALTTGTVCLLDTPEEVGALMPDPDGLRAAVRHARDYAAVKWTRGMRLAMFHSAAAARLDGRGQVRIGVRAAVDDAACIPLTTAQALVRLGLLINPSTARAEGSQLRLVEITDAGVQVARLL